MDPYAIGVDLGGTNLRIAAYAGGKGFLEVIELPTRLAEGRDRVVRDLCGAVKKLEKRYSGLYEMTGVGVGAPGPLELPDGIVRNPPNLPGWDGFRLREAVETGLGRTIELENDANMAALAEQKLGAGYSHGVESLCVLTLGTGVGNGLVIRGAIESGMSGMGGEAGHIVVNSAVDAPTCGCGGAGCLEQYASATAVMRLAKERMGELAPSSARALAGLARTGDPAAAGVFQAVGRSLAIALAGLINTLNLPLYLVGGGVSEAWDLFAPMMFSELRRLSYIYRLTEPADLYSSRFERHKTYIQRAELGSTAGLLGACVSAMGERKGVLVEMTVVAE